MYTSRIILSSAITENVPRGGEDGRSSLPTAASAGNCLQPPEGALAPLSEASLNVVGSWQMKVGQASPGAEARLGVR